MTHTEKCDKCGETVKVGDVTIYYQGKDHPVASSRFVLCRKCEKKANEIVDWVKNNA